MIRSRVARRLSLGVAAVMLVAIFERSACGQLQSSGNTRPIELTLVDDHAIGFATFQSHNQKVVSNRHGVFLTYVRRANASYTAQDWRLMRSADQGKSFELVYESRDATSPPVLETDESDTLYLARPDFLDGHAYLYRFESPRYKGPPSISRIPGASAGKYCMALDEPRRQLYFFSHQNEFRVIGLDGAVRHAVTLTTSGRNAQLQYPHLALAADGSLFAGWTTSVPEGSLYWDIHVVRSPDGGSTWQTLAGKPLAPPIVADDTGPTDRTSRDDEFEAHSWLSSMLANRGKLHMIYWTDTKPARQRYVRYNLSDGRSDVDVEPLFSDLAPNRPNDSGLLAVGRGENDSTLYFVSAVNDRRQLAGLASRDHGRTWQTFAKCDQVFGHRIYSIGGARLLTSDGAVVGTFTDAADTESYTARNSGKVYFFRIPTR